MREVPGVTVSALPGEREAPAKLFIFSSHLFLLLTVSLPSNPGVVGQEGVGGSPDKEWGQTGFHSKWQQKWILFHLWNVKRPKDFLSDALEKIETFFKGPGNAKILLSGKMSQKTLTRSVALVWTCALQVPFPKVHLSVFFVFLAPLRWMDVIGSLYFAECFILILTSISFKPLIKVTGIDWVRVF